MLTRRNFLKNGYGFGLAGAILPAATGVADTGGAVLGDDGLHKQPLFTDSFLELGDDLTTASQNGRSLMILWEQRGCPYCRELHQVNFRRREIVDYVTTHFDVVQLDMFGAREVLDFDGEALEERDLAEKWFVNFTPTTILCDRANTGAADLRQAETFRMPGYLKPFHYLSSLEYVVTQDYRNQRFQRYLQDKFDKLRQQGIDPDVW